jgi:terminase small subunit / prophage DNA-packing protein
MATQEEVARHLDLTSRRVRQLIDEGVLPKRGKDGWDLDACRVLYLRHLRSLASGHGGKQAEMLSTERAALARSQRVRTELWTAIKRGEYVEIAEACRQFDLVVQIVREVLMTIGVRAAPLVVGMFDVVPGQEPIMCESVKDLIDRHVFDAVDTFDQMNRSGGLVERLTQGAPK